MDVDVDLGATQAALASLGQPWAIGPDIGVAARMAAGERWSLRLGVTWRRLWDDAKSAGSVKLPHPDGKATRAWTQASLSLQALRTVGGPRWAPYLGAGLGWSTWKIEQYPGYRPIAVDDGDGNLKDYRADELIGSVLCGIEPALLGSTRLRVQVGADFFTGLGADFAREVNKERSRAQLTLVIGLSFPLQGGSSRSRRESRLPGQSVGTAGSSGSPPGSLLAVGRPGDADGDGILDAHDKCPDTPVGAVVDRYGCPLDADSDGVYDGIDRCPGTTVADRGRVDSTGCVPPIPDTTRPAVPVADTLTRELSPAPLLPPVAAAPAVADADSDGVADSLDRCPDTPKGMEVDSAGCLTITQLDRRLILHVAYISGGTEFDPTSARVMKDLAIRLRAAPDVQATIEGFTDDIGEADANLKLSQKRADKAKAYLVSRRIAANRITAIGKGETSPIADNATALGRRTNRRLEISFQRGQ